MPPSIPSQKIFRLHLWIAARWLPMVAKRRTLEQLLQKARPQPGHVPYQGLTADEVLDAVRAVTARPWRMRGRRCLREGLLGFRFLRLAGFTPVLCFGLNPASLNKSRLDAHCWLTLDGKCILNPPTDSMAPLFSWDGEKIVHRQEDD